VDLLEALELAEQETIETSDDELYDVELADMLERVYDA